MTAALQLSPPRGHPRPILFSGPMVRAILEGRKSQTRRVVNLESIRARLPYAVRSDFAELLPDTAVTARPAIYPLTMNAQGAVAVVVKGKSLGVKPGEFDFICPFAVGTTRLVNQRWHIEPHGRQELWVREKWRFLGTDMMRHGRTHSVQEGVIQYAADERRQTIQRPWQDVESLMHTGHGDRWRPSIFMPRWVSRIRLVVAGVRIERLQDISEEDARAEGVQPLQMDMGSYRPEFEGLWDSINGRRASWASNPWVWVIEFKTEPIP